MPGLNQQKGEKLTTLQFVVMPMDNGKILEIGT